VDTAVTFDLNNCGLARDARLESVGGVGFIVTNAGGASVTSQARSFING
jgi:hypothetical protein